MIDRETYSRISNGETCTDFMPSVQILGIEKVENGFLLDLFDGEETFHGLYLGSKLKEALDSNLISPNHIIKLLDYCFNQTVDTPLIIFEFEQRFNPNQQLKPARLEEDPKGRKFTPISDLLSTSRWELKVRVISKQNIKDYRHSNEVGKYFKLVLIDRAGNLAEMVFFGAKVEEYFNLITRLKVYSISQATVSPPHPNYRKEGVVYEIKSTRETSIEELEEDPEIPQEYLGSKEPIPKGPIVNECGIFEELKQKEEAEKALKKNLDLVTFEQIKCLKPASDCRFNISVLATIGKLTLNETEGLWYQGCSNDRCKRKVSVITFNKYYCSNCRMNYETFIYRYRVMLPMHDSTGMIKVKIFDTYAETLLKVSAQQLNYMSEINRNKAESILLSLFGRKVVAELQISSNGSSKDIVLIRTKPPDCAFETLLADIDYIARISLV